MSQPRKCGRLRILLLGVAALGIGVASSAHADIILFNPNGGGATGALPVETFDEKVGNALAQNAQNLIANLPVGGTTPVFAALFQASIGTLEDVNGNTLASPGTSGTNQLTLIASFNETATKTSANSIDVNLNVSQAGSFIEIYSNPTVTENNLSGNGFRSGTLILKGVADVGALAAGHPVITSTTPVPLDQNGVNNYPNLTSVTAAGATRLSFTVTDTASNYFVTPLTGSTIQFNGSNVVPFNQVDPSLAFYTLPDTGGPLDAAGRPVSTPPGTSPNYTHDLGPQNGAGSGQDFQFQSDANSSFTVVPEPASFTMAATALGLLTLAGWMLRRRTTDPLA